jgi:hypothetical protein
MCVRARVFINVLYNIYRFTHTHIYIYIYIYIIYIHLYIGVLGRQGKRAGRLTAVYYICIIYMYTCIYVCACSRCARSTTGKRAGRLRAVYYMYNTYVYMYMCVCVPSYIYSVSCARYAR